MVRREFGTDKHIENSFVTSKILSSLSRCKEVPSWLEPNEAEHKTIWDSESLYADWRKAEVVPLPPFFFFNLLGYRYFKMLC